MDARLTRMGTFWVMASLFFAAGWLSGRPSAVTEKTVVHAVAWTPRAGATEAGIEEFRRATIKLMSEVPGLRRVWVGPLRESFQHGDQERSYGLVLEFDDVASKEGYSSHPARAPWAEIWARVRIPGSTNFDVIGR